MLHIGGRVLHTVLHLHKLAWRLQPRSLQWLMGSQSCTLGTIGLMAWADFVKFLTNLFITDVPYAWEVAACLARSTFDYTPEGCFASGHTLWWSEPKLNTWVLALNPMLQVWVTPSFSARISLASKEWWWQTTQATYERKGISRYFFKYGDNKQSYSNITN